MKVIVKNVKRVFDDFFQVDRAAIQYEKFDGTMTQELVRLNLNRGNSAAVLILNPQKNSLILIKQFRYPAYVENKTKGWLLEVVAGTIDFDADPLETAKREIVEEVGYLVDKLEPIHIFYPSPGGCSEKIFLYYAEVCEKQQFSKGGGLPGEGEDIQIIELPILEVFQLLDSGQILDAKTIIALQWLRERLK